MAVPVNVIFVAVPEQIDVAPLIEAVGVAFILTVAKLVSVQVPVPTV